MGRQLQPSASLACWWGDLGPNPRKMSGADDLTIVAGVVSAAFRDHDGWVKSSQEEMMAR